MRTASVLRIVVSALGALALAGLSGCFEPASRTCDNGNFCPPGYRCVSSNAYDRTGNICLPESQTCGDGVVQAESEQCDDGKDTAACNGPDAKQAACLAPKCNDGYVNAAAGEVCDPGSTGESLECTKECKRSSCGDGYTNKTATEECDDGAADTATCNGPGASVQQQCKISVCGDSYVNAAAKESCDPGTPGLDTDKCNKDCTDAQCGDGYTNKLASEECDDRVETATCNGPDAPDKQKCKITACGDGYVNAVAKETCDPGAVGLDTDRCNKDCTDARCGDGYTNKQANEECDDSVESSTCNGPNAPELQKCKVTVCGDSYVNAAANEKCDPGTVGLDVLRCNKDCTEARCGDGYTNKAANEECDDGAESPTCNGPNAPDLQKCKVTVCGDNYVNAAANEKCDPGTVGLDTLKCNKDCTEAECGDGYTNKAAGEECDDGVETAYCTKDCKVSQCGDTYINAAAFEECDPGAPNTDSSDCNRDCTKAECGDGYKNEAAGEDCDDPSGETKDCNGPTAGPVACHFTKCGDNYTNIKAEGCDPGAVGAETSGCNSDCTVSKCHDFKINMAAGEDCDPGGGPLTETADCNNDCTSSVCGDGKINKADDRDGSAEMCDDRTCADDVTKCTLPGEVDPACAGIGDGTCKMGSQTCAADCTSAECGDGFVNPLSEECDHGGVGWTDKCNIDCTISRCGDKKENPVTEECDEGGETAACNADCTEPKCGDGKLNRAAGEQCDELRCEGSATRCSKPGAGDPACGAALCISGTANCNGSGECGKFRCEGSATPCATPGAGDPACGAALCVPDCPAVPAAVQCKVSFCGDDYINLNPGSAEKCDPGADFEDAGCNSNCTVPKCGDGIVNRKAPLAGGGTEQCDPGPDVLDPAKPGQTGECNSTCTIARCGDRYVNQAAGEDCEERACEGDGTKACLTDADCAGLGSGKCTTGAMCTATCKVSTCGDGIANPKAGEECDEGLTTLTTTCNNAYQAAVDTGVGCKLPRCGDGQETPGLEECDPGKGQIESATCNSDCTDWACGDLKVNLKAGEQCDEKSCDNGNPCTTDAQCGGAAGSCKSGSPSCNGNTAPAGARCKFARCGDLYANTKAGEDASCDTKTCDDGTTACTADAACAGIGSGRCSQGSKVCTVLCKASTCGDLVVNTKDGEQCDDKTCSNTGAACTVDSQCGGGTCVSGSAVCNGSAAPADARCKMARCGDLYTNTRAGEDPGCDTKTCNDGLTACTTDAQCAAAGKGTCTLGSRTCTALCKASSCGDSVVNPKASEQCDTGGAADLAGCNGAGALAVEDRCRYSSCGDGHVNVPSGEFCDDSNSGSGDGCSGDCKSDESCGNQIVDYFVGEACDNGKQCSGNKSTACTTDAQCAALGLGTCITWSGDGCSADCKSKEACGNGVTDTGEQCDDGNKVDEVDCPYGTKTCTGCKADCSDFIYNLKGPYCGDGQLYQPVPVNANSEVCDDGNESACGTCAADCKATIAPDLASGYLIADRDNDLSSGQYFTLSDGYNNPVTFEFRKSGTAAAGRVQIDLPDLSSTEVALLMVSKINGVGGALRVTASCNVLNCTNARVDLVNDLLMGGVPGNLYANTPIVETGGGDFAASGMSGGASWDCPADTGCKTDTDCHRGTACLAVVPATTPATYKCQAANYTLTVTPPTGGTVKADTGVVDCGTTCADELGANSLVILKAEPSAGFAFAGWTGACSGTGTCSLTMNGAKTVGANFTALVTVNKAASSSGEGRVRSGGGEINCDKDCDTASYAFPAGSTVQFTATAETGSRFSGWSGGSGTCSGLTNPCSVVVDGPRTVTAEFTKQWTLAITMAGGPGTISDGTSSCSTGTCTWTYDQGTVVTLTASGGTLTAYSGSCTGTACSLTMNGDKAVTATFEVPPATRNVKVTVVGTGGTVSDGTHSCDAASSPCTWTHPNGGSVTLTANATAPTTFDGWSVLASCAGSTAPCTVSPLNADVEVTATFTTPSYTVALTVTGDGTVGDGTHTCTKASTAAECTWTYLGGTSVTLTATGVAPVYFDAWGGGTCSGSTSPCTIATLSSNKTVTAAFVTKYGVTVTVSGTGTVGDGGANTCSSGTCGPWLYPAGTNVSLTASGGTLTAWGGACSGTGACAFNPIDADQTVTATFNP